MAVSAMLPVVFPPTAGAQVVEGKLWVTDRPVHAVLPTDTALYIGGEFNLVGPATGAAVSLDEATAAVQLPYPQVAGWVYTVAPDGGGGWYVGGDFHTAQGPPRNNLARFDAYGNLLPWNPNANGIVRALLVAGGTVYVGGDFSNVGGQTRNFLAGLDGTTGAATSFNPSPSGAVRALTQTGSGTMLVGGDFTLMGPMPRSRLAAFDLTSGTITGWNPGVDGPVLALASKITGVTTVLVYVGGQFTQLGGASRSNLGVVDLSNNLQSWNPGANAAVRALRIGPGSFGSHTLYAGGDFTTLGGQARNHLGSVSSTSSTATSWNPDANGSVAALGLDGTTLYAGGDFTSIGGQPRNHLAAIDAAGAATDWNPSANGSVWAIATSVTRVYAGGALTSVSCVTRNHLAMLDLATGAATAWDPDVDDTVEAMIVRGDTLYFGGRFTHVGGTMRSRLASVHATTGALTSWNPSADFPVLDMLDYGGSIRVCGSFNGIGGTFRANIAGLDPITGLATSWEPNALGAVYTLALRTRTTAPFTTTIFAGGQFTAIGGALRSRVAELDPVGGTATSWNPPTFDNVGYTVNCIVPTDTFIYVGGSFYSIGGTPRTGIAAFYGDTGQLSGWDASTVFPCQVDAMALQDFVLYTGGYFDGMGGQPRHGLGALNPFSAVATGWQADVADPYLVPVAFAMAARGPTLYVGEQFSSIAGLPHAGVAAVTLGATAVEEPVVSVAPAMLVHAEPNPSQAAVTLRFSLPAAGTGEVAIYDLAGRLVRRVRAGELPAGEHRVLWDGRDAAGRSVSSGVYVARVRGVGFDAKARIVRVR